MKVIFKPRQFSESEGAGKIIAQGTFHGLGIDFLAVMARLYQMPFLWFSEGIFIEIDFESEKLILKASEDKGEDFHAREVVQEIPLEELVAESMTSIRERYIRPFAANLAEYNFGMPKTAKAIREYWHQSIIEELAAEEGHPVLDTEIMNLLVRDGWDLTTSYKERKKSLTSSFLFYPQRNNPCRVTGLSRRFCNDHFCCAEDQKFSFSFDNNVDY